MNKHFIVGLACLTMVGALSLPGEQAAAKSPQKQLVILQAPTAAAQGVRTIQAQLLVNAPPSMVWNTITQYGDFQDFMPGYQKSTVVSRQGNMKMLNLEVRPSTFTPLYRYQIKVMEQPQAYRLFFERTQGDFKFMKAQYQLTPRNSGKQTLLTYTLSIDPGSSLPGTNGILKSHTERSLYAVSSYTEEMAYKSLIGQR